MNLSVLPVTLVELPAAIDLAEYLDWCLARDEPLLVDLSDIRLFLVPDMLRLEWLAGGDDLPDTISAQVADGRQVFVYRVVAGKGYPLRPADGD